MSSPKGAAARSRRPAASAKPKVVTSNALSADAIKLADEIERAFAKSDDAISAEAMQVLMGALCRVYSAQVENGAKFTPIAEGQKDRVIKIRSALSSSAQLIAIPLPREPQR